MKKKDTNLQAESDVNRRDFLKGGSLATLMAMLGGVEIKAQEESSGPASGTTAKPVGPPVNIGVIGLGSWGRDILATLAQLPNAPVVAVSDTYAVSLRRSGELAPNAEKFEDYRKLLEKKEVQAVIVATPTHQHKQVVKDALNAGKSVYCEAPLASTIEEAREIAQAARKAFKQHFQAGLQARSDPQRHFLVDFIRSGALGDTIMGRGQWNKKQSWRRISPNPDREKELNWRLQRDLSLGLVGEAGIHQIDGASWFLRNRPEAVTGFGSVVYWKDGRNVADTVQAVFEYPGGVLHTFASTLANSFEGEYDIFYGTHSAVMMRGNKAWMFKEVDSPLLGWEVYAKKDAFHNETGIVLMANATKLNVQADQAEVSPFLNTPLYFALEAFVANSYAHRAAVEDFTANFGDDAEALREYLVEIEKNKLPYAGYQGGFEATVVVAKANEAIHKKQKVVFSAEWFEI